MKTFFYGLLMALLVAGCAKKTKSLSGVYMYYQDNLYSKYEFQADGMVKYKSDLNGQFYHTKTGTGTYVIKETEVIVNIQGMMDFSQPISFQTTFKMEKNDLIDISSVGADGKTNMDDQIKYIRQN
jgi:hypothetical protein